MAVHERRLRSTGQGGFTLIELIVVVGIIAVLTGVVVFSVGNARQNAAKNACQTELFAFTTASNASEVDPDDNIRSYLSVDVGDYFQVSGTNGFTTVPGSGFDAGCSPI